MTEIGDPSYVAGAEITFDPAAVGSPQPHVIYTDGTGATMARATIEATALSAPVTCQDYIDLSCTVTLRVTTVEVIRHGRIVATHAGVAAGPHERLVNLGTKTVNIVVGRTAIVPVALDASGRRLLSATHRINATLTLTHFGSLRLASQSIRFTSRHH